MAVILHNLFPDRMHGGLLMVWAGAENKGIWQIIPTLSASVGKLWPWCVVSTHSWKISLKLPIGIKSSPITRWKFIFILPSVFCPRSHDPPTLWISMLQHNHSWIGDIKPRTECMTNMAKLVNVITLSYNLTQFWDGNERGSNHSLTMNPKAFPQFHPSLVSFRDAFESNVSHKRPHSSSSSQLRFIHHSAFISSRYITIT